MINYGWPRYITKYFVVISFLKGFVACESVCGDKKRVFMVLILYEALIYTQIR